MNRLGAKSNTGEGRRRSCALYTRREWRLEEERDQAGRVGRFGVTSEYLVNADDLQIKMAQGASPAKADSCPGTRCTRGLPRCAMRRPGWADFAAAAPRHLLDRGSRAADYDLKNAKPRAPDSRQAVAEVGVGTVAAGVAKAHSDVVLISGHDGGTGRRR
jgi:glutamate synthase domain-containing protein 2